MDTYISNITEHISNTSKMPIPNKKVNIRKSDPKWLNGNIDIVLRKKYDVIKEF